MPKLVWDEVGERLFETGVKKGVLYKYDSKQRKYGKGVAWNGLSSVSESPEGADETAIYADDIKYQSLRAAEEFGGTIEAYMCPEEFLECDGTKQVVEGVNLYQQPRSMFGFSYVTTIGNDTEGVDHGYKIHIVYGATCSPSGRDYATINDSPEAITFSWEFSTIPFNIDYTKINADLGGYRPKPTALITIDSTKVPAAKIQELEDILYGTASEDARLPEPEEIIDLLAA